MEVFYKHLIATVFHTHHLKGFETFSAKYFKNILSETF